MDGMNQIVVTSEDVLEAVRQTAMLADVSISTWSGMRNDPERVAEAKQKHGARGKVGRFQKDVMSGGDAQLKRTQSAHHAVRTKHYEMTLPWVSDPTASRQSGPRLLPHALFNQYMTEMSALQREAKAELEELIRVYPDMVEKAKNNLNTMAKDTDYPTVDQLRAAFKVHFDWWPIPDGGGFQSAGGLLTPERLQKLSQRLTRNQQSQVEVAQQAMWSKAKKEVEHLVERLTDDTGGAGVDPKKFKSATIENVRELLTLLPGWNVTGDPRVGEIVGEIDKLLQGIDSKELKKNDYARSATAARARRVVDKMKSWGV